MPRELRQCGSLLDMYANWLLMETTTTACKKSIAMFLVHKKHIMLIE